MMWRAQGTNPSDPRMKKPSMPRMLDSSHECGDRITYRKLQAAASLPLRIGVQSVTAPFLVAVAVLWLLLSGCSNEASRREAPAAGDRASSTTKHEATAPREPRTKIEGSSGSGVGAQPSDRLVPDVGGMEAGAACRALLRRGYAGGIFCETREAGMDPGRVVKQDPKPGYEGGEGQLVHLVVSEPFRDALPPGSPCVERRADTGDTPRPE